MSEASYYKGKNKLKFLVPEKVRRNIKKIHFANKFKNVEAGVLPDFLVIGQMKCGTSSLYYYLSKHPQILEAVEKEVNYFNFNYELGTDYYRKNFPTANTINEYKALHNLDRVVTGEATPEYLLHPHCPERVRSVLPNAKLIVIMRDPVERAFSHYKHACRFGMENLNTFEEAIALEPERTKEGKLKLINGNTEYSFPFHQFSYLERGFYKEQIDRWLKFYDTSDFLFLKLEELQERPKETVNKVFEFLKLEPYELAEYPNRFVGKPGNIDPDTKAKLKQYFQDANNELEELTGISWK